MNDDMRRLFAEHHRIDGPPLRVTTEEITRRGRRRVLRRNVGVTGGLGAVVALVAAAAMLLPGAFVSANTPPAGVGDTEPATADEPTGSPTDPPKQQPEYPLPDVPDAPHGQYYSWDVVQERRPASSEAAEAYGDAFVAWFDEAAKPLKDWPGMQINHRALLLGPSQGEGSHDVVDESIPIYGIASDEGDGSTPYGDRDSVGLTVYPRGSFKQGPGDTHEYLATCTDGTALNGMAGDTDYTCDEQDGPNDTRILTVGFVQKVSGVEKTKWNRVFVYRADGTAVEVSDFVTSWDEGEPASDPKLGFDELTELALSMPGAVVED